MTLRDIHFCARLDEYQRTSVGTLQGIMIHTPVFGWYKFVCAQAHAYAPVCRLFLYMCTFQMRVYTQDRVYM